MSESKEKRSQSLNNTSNKNEILIGDYILKHTIGKGTFSRVKLGINKNTGEKVAIKILDKKKIVEKADLERVLREMKMLSELDNEHIIKVYQIYENENHYLIIMEYCEGGELFNYIVEKQRLSENESSFFYYQIIQGVEYIHSRGIAHRDLKPENLLLDKNKKIKIIDFGLSNYFDGVQKLETPCGSPCYASPEMVGGNKYNGFIIDIWATGIILFAMLCGYLPFEDDNNDVLFKQILSGKIDYPKHLSEVSKDLLRKIIETNPEKRIKIEEIKQHPFYLMGKKLYEKKFKKMKIQSLREFNYDIIFNKVNHDKEKDKEISSKTYIQTEINERKNNLNKDKEITLQNELINNNKIGLLTKCLNGLSIKEKTEKNQNQRKKIRNKTEERAKAQIFFTTRINKIKNNTNVENILKYFNKSQFHFNKEKTVEKVRHFKNNEKKKDKKITLQNIRKNFDSDKKKEKMNIFKENLLKYNITELSNNLNNVNKQINDNKSILINNAVINLNMFTDKTEINLENKQNTLKDMKAYHKSPLILRLFNNKKTNFPSIRITDNNESKNKRITNRIHLKTESNIIKEMSQHYKIRNINRTNNFFRLKLNSNLKFNSLYKK
jgi:serine/threonine protein kinase